MTVYLQFLLTFGVGFFQLRMTDCSSWRATALPPTDGRQRMVSGDYRTVSFEELLMDRNSFRYGEDGVEGFSNFVIDRSRRQVIVGARDHVLRLSLDDLTPLEKVGWFPDSLNITTCLAKGQTTEDCHNYVRVLILHNDGLFICGTNAFSPLCSWRRPDRVSTVDSWVPGVAKCPYSPHQNSTFLMTSDRNYYSATVTDFTARDAAIYRTIGPSKYLRTVRFNSHWLNEPDFVSSYEISDYIYFFFRETAIEYINCGKTVYPRVARICKSDSGGKILLEDNWTTFLKARLNCSLPGSYPFYFNDLQSTFYDEVHQQIYAVFTTSPTSIYASAVCIYNITTIDLIFSGPYKHQSDAQMAWTRVPNTLPDLQCPSAQPKQSLTEGNQFLMQQQRPLLDIQQYQMMDSAVQPITLDPLVVMETERYSHIVMDHINVSYHSSVVEIPVLFLATLEGVIHKMALLPNGNSTTVCLVEKIHMSTGVSPGLIFSMKLHKEQRLLFISTRHSFYRLPVQRCSRFKTKMQCLAAQDPYCGWDDPTGSCAPSGHPGLSSCPLFDFPVDGKWSRWSSWLPCSHTRLANHGDQCLCRVRSCDSPKPSSKGRECDGHSIEVSNCTVHGGWTQWSHWSACSMTCGTAHQMRTRTCSSPSPEHGGRTCDGEDSEEIECKLSPCPTAPPFLPVHGGWSDWTDWTPCSVICGIGFQSRMRSCSRPSPKHGGRTCTGNHQEWQTCNMGDCEEVRKVSEWSPWLRINSTKDGSYQEERFRCVCKAVVVDPLQLRTPSLKTSMRFCTPGGEDCDTGHMGIPDVDGSWSEWSSWTICSALCGSGSQHRERLCNSPSASGSGRECPGPSRELQTCNIHSCVAQWSCWSESSPCSVSCGAGGVRRRHRVCESELNSERQFVLPCEGEDVEVMPCERSPCQGVSSDWSGWSEWSSCNSENLQKRNRFCLAQKRIQCFGTGTESRMCVFVETAVRVNQNSEIDHHKSTTSSIQAYHLVVTSLLGFFLGTVFGAIVFHLFRRHRRRHHHREKQTLFEISTTTNIEVKPNDYLSCDEVIPLPPNLSDDCHTYSTLTFNTKAKDATLKRNVSIQRSESLMRTKLDQPDAF